MRSRFVAMSMALALAGCSVVDDLTADDADGDAGAATTTVHADEAVDDGAGEIDPAPFDDADDESDDEPGEDGRISWAPTGSGGGGAFSAPSVAADGTLLVGSDLSGAYLSRTGGSWTTLGASRGLTDTHVSATVFAPGRSDVFVLGTDGGIHRSLDGGTSIERVADGGYTTALVAVADETFLAARAPEWNQTGTSIWRSDDLGGTWSELAPPPRPDAYILGFRLDLTDADRVLALSGPSRFAVGAAAVFESADDGATWVELPLPGPPADLRQTGDGTWWLTTNTAPAEDDPTGVGSGSLYRSTDLIEWTAVVGDLTGVIVPTPDDGDGAIAVFDLDRWNRAADTAPVVFADLDGLVAAPLPGDAWNAGWSSAPWAFEFGFDGAVRTSTVTADGELVWVNGQFVYRSDGSDAQPLHTFASDSGWASTGVDNTVAIAVSVSPHDADDVIAGYLDLGLWVSTDGGGAWESRNDPAWTAAWLGAGGNATAVAHDPLDPDAAWAALGGDIGADPVHLVRRSGGPGERTWSEVALPDDASRVTDLAPAASSLAIAVVVDGTLVVAPDRTAESPEWTAVTDCDDGCQVVVESGTGWFVGGSAGLWSVSSAGISTRVLLVEGSTGEPSWWSPAYAGVSDVDTARNGAEVWVAVTGADGGFWQSTDGADTWTRALEDGWARGVDVDDRVPGRVLVASSSATLSGGFDATSDGLRVSVDGGRSFTDADGDLPWPFALRVVTGPGVLWAVSPGVGLAVADDPLAD